MKVQMACRHTAITGVKLEPGFVYEFPDRYARELIDSGIAVLVPVPVPTPVIPPPPVDIPPSFADVNLKPVQSKIPKIYVKSIKAEK
jgi:hypothetical protein